MRKTEFVKSYFDAWNHRDPEGIAAHFSVDGTYRDIPECVQISPDQLVINLEDFFAKFRHRYELIGEVQKSENTIAFQYRMCLFDNHHSKMALSQSYRGAEFITLNGDAAITITDYYDIPMKTPVNKYAKSGLSRDQLRTYKRRLDEIMQSQNEYLKPDLTLPRLAQSIG